MADLYWDYMEKGEKKLLKYLLDDGIFFIKTVFAS